MNNIEINRPLLSIRDIVPEDAHHLNRYWANNTQEDLMRLGEIGRPDPQKNIEFIEQFCRTRTPPERSEEGILIWMMGEVPIGYSTLKEIRYGNDAQIHLHMWDRSQRGKGIGAVLHCLSALRFIKDFHLKSLYCQPKFDNPMPNGMLRKIGFPLLGQVDWKHPGNGSVVRQNKYLISLDIINKYLTKVKHHIPFQTPA